MHRTILLIFISLALLLQGCGPSEIGGTYVFGDSGSGQAFGRLKIHPAADGQVLFFLEVNQGAPAYRMVQLDGELELDGRKGLYNSKVAAAGASCELSFDFLQGSVEVSVHPERNRCGFGGDVPLDHVFKLVDRAVPIDYVDAQGDTVLFERVTLSR
ncbi:hypothetical protein [Pedobacter sp.]